MYRKPDPSPLLAAALALLNAVTWTSVLVTMARIAL